MDEIVTQLVQVLQAGGVLVALVIALVAGYKRLYVFRPEFEDERADKLEWKQLYLEAMDLAQQGAAIAESAMTSDRESRLAALGAQDSVKRRAS